ncbi:hypothetical protein MHU86_12519 [Fragilaria crotonensis]|nr:hypothetical protein MHU86_12519 [Fragilaria crotonensis]
MYHARSRNSVISLRKPALQRLIIQRLKERSRPSDIVHVPIMIRFLLPDNEIPKPPGSSASSQSTHGSRSHRSRQGPPSVVDTSAPMDVPVNVVAPGMNEEIAPTADDAEITDSTAAIPTFRGQPVDTRPTGGHGPPFAAGRFHTPPGTSPPLQFDNSTAHEWWKSDSDAYTYASFLCRSHFRRRILRRLHESIHVWRSQVQRFSQG